jgi:hypothetical protein
MDQANKPQDYLPRVWAGERVHPSHLMNLYSQATRGEITVHIVGLEGLVKMLTVFTEAGNVGNDPYNPPSRATALEAVAQRRRVDVSTLKYIGALVGE